jgi:phosphatidylserine/phosphatidylglycerophosphate/cardiolipin synthase-like enzyme
VSLLEQTGDLPIQSFIAGARHALDCELYEVTTSSFADALGAAAQRGVRVRVILEPQAWSTLLVQRESGVQVLPTPRVALDHTKSCVRDAGTSRMATLVGTANWSASAVSKDAAGHRGGYTRRRRTSAAADAPAGRGRRQPVRLEAAAFLLRRTAGVEAARHLRGAP